MHRRVAIITVGDELLSGRTVDTNAAWLADRLGSWGDRVVRIATVGDDAEAIRSALSTLMTLADSVVITGGLGPTPDDLTKAAVADFLARPLVESEVARAAVEAYFAAAGEPAVPERSYGQWLVIEGAEPLENPHGTAPGLLVSHEGTEILLLPGVPREMRGIVDGAYRSRRADSGTVAEAASSVTLHTTGLEEPLLADRVESVWPDGPPPTVQLAYLPDELGVDLRLSAPADGVTLQRAVAELEEALGDLIHPGDLAAATLDLLRARGWTVSTAESCTGGMIGARLTDVPGSSDVVVGGIIAYANRVKVDELGVDPTVLERDGAVSEAVARAMAAGAAARFGSQLAVAVTGVAGPGGGSEEKPVGTVWFGLSVEGSVSAERRHFAGDREAVRRRTTHWALAMIYRTLRAG